MSIREGVVIALFAAIILAQVFHFGRVALRYLALSRGRSDLDLTGGTAQTVARAHAFLYGALFVYAVFWGVFAVDAWAHPSSCRPATTELRLAFRVVGFLCSSALVSGGVWYVDNVTRRVFGV